MLTRPTELEDFKKKIDLRAYALSRGYVLDTKTSSRTSAALETEAGDKVVIARNTNQHWIYFSVRDETDNGSIIDFIQNRDRTSLGEVRKELREWIAAEGKSPSAEEDTLQELLPLLEPITKDLAMVRARYLGSQVVSVHPYLEAERGIPEAVLTDPRVLGRIRIDRRRNAIFPHWNRDGVCGYEVKNLNFTGFAPGGEKGLWYSQKGEGSPAVLVIAETAIDALSYAALWPNSVARYVSTGGALNPMQPDLIRGLMEKMEDGQVIVAVDNDEGGDSLLTQIQDIHQQVGRDSLELAEDRPVRRGEDWNQVLLRG